MKLPEEGKDFRQVFDHVLFQKELEAIAERMTERQEAADDVFVKLAHAVVSLAMTEIAVAAKKAIVEIEIRQ